MKLFIEDFKQKISFRESMVDFTQNMMNLMNDFGTKSREVVADSYLGGTLDYLIDS